MAFRDFDFPDVQHALGLTLAEADLFGGVAAVDLPADFIKWMRGGIDLALAVNTEKARSEFIIALILFELRQLSAVGFGLFSGIEFDVDSARAQRILRFHLDQVPLAVGADVPVVAIVEAKNDNLRTGLGQCIAAVVAAREFNTKSAAQVPVVHGAVTTGKRMEVSAARRSGFDSRCGEYFVTELARIMGILMHILKAA